MHILQRRGGDDLDAAVTTEPIDALNPRFTSDACEKP